MGFSKPFVPSRALACLVLSASRPSHKDEEDDLTVTDDLGLTPHSPSDFGVNVTDRLCESIGVRVERVLTNVALSALAHDKETAMVSEGTKFAQPVERRLVESFGLELDREQVLARLVTELTGFLGGLENNTFVRAWGQMIQAPGGQLMIQVDRRPGMRVGSDPEVRVVGGAAIHSWRG